MLAAFVAGALVAPNEYDVAVVPELENGSPLDALSAPSGRLWSRSSIAVGCCRCTIQEIQWSRYDLLNAIFDWSLASGSGGSTAQKSAKARTCWSEGPSSIARGDNS